MNPLFKGRQGGPLARLLLFTALCAGLSTSAFAQSITSASVVLSNGPVYSSGGTNWYTSTTQNVNLAATSTGSCFLIGTNNLLAFAFHSNDGSLGTGDILNGTTFGGTQNFSRNNVSANAFAHGAANQYRIKVSFGSSCLNIREASVDFFVDATAPNPPSSAPVGPGATSCDTEITWTWGTGSDGQSGVRRYRVAVGLTPGGDEIGNFNVSGTSFTFTQALVGNTYYASVQTEDNVGLFSSSVQAATGTTILPQTGAVTLSGPADNATCQSDTPTLEWTGGANATSFDVTIGATTHTGLTSPFSPPALAAGQSFSWFVTANGDCNSPVSGTRNFSVAPVAPDPADALSPGDAAAAVSYQPTLSWSAPGGGGPVADYEVFFGLAGGSLTSLGVTASTSASPGTLTPGASYEWYVRTAGPCGLTADTATQSFTVNDAPTDITTGGLSVSSEAGNGTLVGTATVVDPDNGPTPFDWTLVDNAGGRFSLGTISGTTVEILVANSSLISDANASFDIALTVEDADGLSIAAPVTLPVTVVDDTAPIVSANALTARDTTPPLTGTVDDTTATVTVDVDGQTGLVATNQGDGTWLLPDNTLTALADGRYDITVTATDFSPNANVGSSTATGALLIDATAPAVTVDAQVSPESTPTVTGTVSDVNGMDPGDFAGTDTLIITIAGNSNPIDLSSMPAWSIQWPHSLANGVYDVSYSTTDTLGNVGAGAVVGVLEVAANPPAVTIPTLITNDDQPTLTGSISDPDGVVSAEVTLDGNVLGNATLSGVPVDTWTIAVPAPLADGTYSVSITAEDTFGNVGVTENLSGLIIDATPPVFSGLVVTPEQAEDGQTVTIAFDSDEAIAGNPDVTVNGEIASGPMKTAESFVYTYTITPTDPLGPATVTVSGSDLAGNPAVLSDPNAFEIIEPGSALPTLGGLGLGLLAGMMALGGAVLVRRRKP